MFENLKVISALNEITDSKDNLSELEFRKIMRHPSDLN